MFKEGGSVCECARIFFSAIFFHDARNVFCRIDRMRGLDSCLMSHVGYEM